MSEFQLHTEDTAPEGSQQQLAESKQAFGMVPNLHAVMAEAPNVLAAYKKLHELFTTSSFNNEEQTVIWQTINVEHDCHYCVPAHYAIAEMSGVDNAISEALVNGGKLPENLEVLRDITLKVVRERGRIDDADIQRFLDAGYTRQQLLELVLGVSQKVMSNYINHFADTPVDEPFKKYERKAA